MKYWLPYLLSFVAGTADRQTTSYAVDPAEFYGSRLLFATLAAGIAVTLFSLLKYRGRTNSTASWAVLVLSVCVLPPAAMLVGTPLVFERAERIEFCGSCHAAMKPYLTDMANPESQSLAAIHYRNRYIPQDQCYVCHTSFGLFGTLQAKLAGLEDVRRYYLKTYGHPISMRAPYPSEECLKCHADAVRWRAQHTAVRDDLLSGRMRCFNCHGSAHPAHILD